MTRFLIAAVAAALIGSQAEAQVIISTGGYGSQPGIYTQYGTITPSGYYPPGYYGTGYYTPGYYSSYNSGYYYTPGYYNSGYYTPGYYDRSYYSSPRYGRGWRRW